MLIIHAIFAPNTCCAVITHHHRMIYAFPFKGHIQFLCVRYTRCLLIHLSFDGYFDCASNSLYDTRRRRDLFMSHVALLNNFIGTSLAVQWLGLRLPMQGVRVRSLVGELRFHMPRGQKTKTEAIL